MTRYFFFPPRPLRKVRSSRNNFYLYHSSLVWLSQYNFIDSLHVWFVLIRYTSLFICFTLLSFALKTERFYYICLLFLLLPRKSYNLLYLSFSGNGRSKGSGRDRTIKEHIITKRFRRGLENELYSLKLRYISLRIYMRNFTLAFGVRGKDEWGKKTNQTNYPLF